MALLSHTDLSTICDEAIARGLAGTRNTLFFGFDDGVVARIKTASDGATEDDLLRRDADRLNKHDERTADGYFLAMWLRNCAAALADQPDRRAFFLDWASKVDRLLGPVSPPTITGPTGIAATLDANRAGDPIVSALIVAMAGFVNALAIRAKTLMVGKRLHEHLHRIQIFTLPTLRSLIGTTEPGVAWQPLAQQQLQSLVFETRPMETVVGELTAGDELALLAGAAIARIRAEAAVVAMAIDAPEIAVRMTALYNLRNEIKDAMTELADEIDGHVRALDLKALIAYISDLEQQTADAKLAAKAEESVRTLTVILQDISSLARQHRDWQKVDWQLWSQEDFFDHLAEGAFVRESFSSQWTRLSILLVRIAGEPPAAWLEPNAVLRDLFVAACPMPVTGPPDAKTTERFKEFMTGTRMLFHEVDQLLLQSCVRLDKIADQLARL